MRQERADQVLATLEFGVSHVDTTASYGESGISAMR